MELVGGGWVESMPPSKFEQVERLIRALVVREGELAASDEVVRKATLRSESLRAAIRDLRATIEQLISDGGVPAEILARAPLEIQRLAADPMRLRTEGTLLARVLAFVESLPRAVEAAEISQALGIHVDSVRTVLSKLKARGQIERLETGQYCSMQHAHDIRGEPETR
jgi:hypothetical protein